MRGREQLAITTLAAIASLAFLACAAPRLPSEHPSPLSGHPSPHSDWLRETEPSEPLLRNVRQLTFAGRRSGEGYFGPGAALGETQRMVFQSEREPGNPFYQIYWMGLVNGDVERVSPGVGKTTCGWIHPDGKRVLFASTHLDPEAKAKQAAELAERETGKLRRYSWDYDPSYDLFVSEPSHGPQAAPLRLTEEWGYDAEASWSPDGRHIAWASNRHAYATELSPEDRQRLETDPAYFMEIYLSDGDGRSPRRLSHTPGYDGGPFFSPDGGNIVWRRFSEDGSKAEIFSMRLGDDAADQEIQQLTRLDAMSWAPFYHPSGDYIVFATNLHGFGNFELYAVDTKGHKEPVRVTHRKGFDGLPAFAPDGETISWTSGRTGDGNSQIFLADWDDAKVRRLLGLPSRHGSHVQALLPVPSLSPAVRAEDLRAHVAALTSDATEGRLTGSAGERIATGYIARVFRSLGLDPAGDHGGYFQEFDFVAGVSLGDGNFLRATRRAGSSALDEWSGGKTFEVDRDWRPLAFSSPGVADPAEVVFAGYGLVAPASDHTPELDAYSGLDVTDKWVLVFRYIPEGLPPPARQHLYRRASLRFKAMLARDRGARGLLVVSGPRSKVKNQLVKLAFDTSLASSSITAISISDALADGLLRTSGRDLTTLQREFDRTEGDSAGFLLTGVRVEARVNLTNRRASGRNVLARLKSNADVADGERPILLIGAHLDHLGRGEAQGSLARDDEKGRIHPGADDNASGVSSLLEIAQELVTRQSRGELALQRDVLFAAWSGEELGLLGSSHFASRWSDPDDPHAPLSSRVAAYINMDMVGRMRDQLLLYGVDSSSVWPRTIEAGNARLGVPIVAKADSFLPSDSTPFAAREVPTLSAFTGIHSEYHTPRDASDTLNIDGLVGITQLLSVLSVKIAERRDSLDYVPQEQPSGTRATAGFRAYLGTIPDYAASEADGLQLSGVISGGPAEKAGLRGGDIVTRLADRRVENIYDYTFALEALEIGVEVNIVVRRADETLTLKLVPASRE